MAVSRARLFVVARKVNPLAACQTNPSAGGQVEGRRGLTTNPSYKTPYPYKNKGFGFFQSLFDYTTARFNENTRIISVEGLPCVGKSAFASKLANHFQLQTMPALDDRAVFNTGGFDCTQINQMTDNHKLICYTFDRMYREPDPTKLKGMYFTQMHMLRARYIQYVEALVHVLNTGQGVVLENAVWSDVNYATTLYKMGYFPRRGFHYYDEQRQSILYNLWKPHLILYLEASNEVILERMHQKRPDLKDSPIFNAQYLDMLRNNFEKVYLPYMSKYCEVLKYTITDDMDYDLLFMDFENEDFMSVRFGENYKYKDWRKEREQDFSAYRVDIMNESLVDRHMFAQQDHNNTDLFFDGYDVEEMNSIFDRIPQLRADGRCPADPKEPLYNPFMPAAGSYLDPRYYNNYKSPTQKALNYIGIGS